MAQPAAREQASAPRTMRAMVFEGVARPLRAVERPIPIPEPGQLLVRVHACGVCRTDLHLLDGEVEISSPPRILGHQIVGTVEGTGARVGVPWLYSACGHCEFCLAAREPVCAEAQFGGYTKNGGFAEYIVAGSAPIATATGIRPSGFAARARRKCSAPCFCVCQCIPVVRSS